jgi:hypothetical protein
MVKLSKTMIVHYVISNGQFSPFSTDRFPIIMLYKQVSEVIYLSKCGLKIGFQKFVVLKKQLLLLQTGLKQGEYDYVLIKSRFKIEDVELYLEDRFLDLFFIVLLFFYKEYKWLICDCIHSVLLTIFYL